MESSKSAIPSGNLVLLFKPNPKGECKVYLRYHFKGKYVKKTTDVSVPAADWDAKRQCLRKTNRNATRINALLQSIKAEADAKLLAHKGELTHEAIAAALGLIEVSEDEVVEVPGARDFVEYAHDYNDLMYKRQEYGYSSWYNKKKYIDAFNWFVTKYERGERLTLDTLNVDIFNRYIAYRFEDKNNKSREAVNKTLVPLYEAVKYAVSNGLVEMKDAAPIVNNYIQVRETSYNPEDNQDDVVKYLTEEQIQAIEEIQPKMKNQRTREIIDFFLFSYYACGMRLSDILTLEWSQVDLENKVIDKVQVKTKARAEVLTPICKKALDILLRWKEYGRNKRFVFDLLPENYDMSDQRKLFMQRNAKDKTFNRSLLTVSMTLRLPTVATMHSARHSFAVMAINKGMSIYMLSKLMGHSTIQATEKTYAKFLRKKVDEDIKMVLEM